MLVDDLLSAFKIYLQIDTTDTTQDDLLKEILLGAESFIFNYYNVAILDRNITELFTFKGSFIYTKKGLIRTINSITIDGESVSDLTPYIFERNKIIQPIGTPFNSNISIDYNIGFLDIDSIPYGLKTGLFIFGKKLYNDATKNADTYTQISSNIRENIKFQEQLPLIADELLSTFKIFRL